MKKISIIAAMLAAVVLSAGCGAKKEAEETYDYSKEYAAAAEHLQDCILDGDAYDALKEQLDAFEDKDVGRLSKKDALTLKNAMEEVEACYSASRQAVIDALAQIGEAYPTEEGFYDDAFKISVSAMLKELNGLMDKGHYKAASAKLNEITSAYTAYVEGKGQTVTAEIRADAAAASAARDHAASPSKGSDRASGSNAGSGSGSTTSGGNAGSGSGGTVSGGNTGSGSGSTTSGGGTGSASGSTTSGGNKTNTFVCGLCGQTVAVGDPHSHAQGTGTTAPKPSSGNPATEKKTYTWTCPECGAVITGVEGDDKCHQHDIIHINEQAEAFKYVSGATNAMIAWERENGIAITDQDAWLREHGYDPALLDSYCAKYGW